MICPGTCNVRRVFGCCRSQPAQNNQDTARTASSILIVLAAGCCAICKWMLKLSAASSTIIAILGLLSWDCSPGIHLGGPGLLSCDSSPRIALLGLLSRDCSPGIALLGLLSWIALVRCSPGLLSWIALLGLLSWDCYLGLLSLDCSRCFSFSPNKFPCLGSHAGVIV